MLAAAWRLAAHVGALSSEWHGFNVLHTAAARMAGWTSASFRARTARRGGMLGGGVDVLWLLGADDFDASHIGAAPSWSIRATMAIAAHACGRDPAGRGLYRKIRHVCEHRRPGAARPRQSIRRARRARTGRSCARSAPHRQDAAVRRSAALRARLEQVNPVFGRVGFLPRFGCSDLTAPAGDPTVLCTRRSSRR